MKRSKTFKALLATLCMTVGCSVALTACGNPDNGGTGGGTGGTGGSEQTVSTKPTLTVSNESETLTGRLGEPFTLPTATASDTIDGDITDDIEISIYFPRDTLTVYSSKDGDATHTFTPTKVGEYNVIYKVYNSKNKNERKTLILTIEDSDSGTAVGQQLVKDQENWICSDGNGFDEEGNLCYSAKPNSSIAYGGRKILSGDTVSFRFSIDKGDEFFYTVNAHMSNSYNAEAPTIYESCSGFPKRLAMRISDGAFELYTASYNNYNVPFNRVSAQVCDGKDHTISLRSTVVNSSTVRMEVWIDADPEGASTWNTTITADELIDEYGDEIFNTYFADMFDENAFGGYFNIGSYDGNASGKMTIKSMAINGEQYINQPQLTVETELDSSYLLNQEITFPSATAEDLNTYSNLTSKIKLTVTTPSAATVDVQNYKYTPTEKGKYSLTYSVTDLSGNTNKVEYEFTVVESFNTEGPTITFAEGATDNLTATVGTAFTLPVPTAVVDQQNVNLSDRMEIALLGCEGKSLTGSTEVVFRTQGVHTIRYSVTDDTGFTTEKDVTVTVAGMYSSDTDLAVEDYYAYKSSTPTYSVDGVQAKYTGYVKGQKVYDEKITMTLKGDILGSFVYVNLRGGKGLDDPASTDMDWQNGIVVEINCATSADGEFIVNYGSHGSNSSTYSIPAEVGTMRDLVKAGAEISFQVTDVCDNDGNIISVSVNIWLNGTQITPDGGHIFGSSFLQANPGTLTAGWFTVSGYEYQQIGGEGQNLETTYVSELYIDDGTANE